MPCLNFFARDSKELVQTVLGFITDPAKMGVAAVWTMITPALPINFKDECIIKGRGKDGKDEIYIGIKLEDPAAGGNIAFNGFAAYDNGLTWAEQPGHIYHKTLPVMPLPTGTRYECWLTANAQRFVIVVQLSTQFEHAYCGFIDPISVERQYPYPLMIAGSHYTGGSWSDYSNTHSAWFNPGGSGDNTSLRLRLSDGRWQSGMNNVSNHTPGASLPTTNQVTGTLLVWPQNVSPVNVLTVLDDELTVENVIMFPIILYQGGIYSASADPAEPAGIVGQVDGVYFIGNREDLSSKDTLIHNGKPYLVFANIDRRDNDSYIAMEWF